MTNIFQFYGDAQGYIHKIFISSSESYLILEYNTVQNNK